MEKINQLKDRLEFIQSNWNGKEAGVQEDRAHLATEALAFMENSPHVMRFVEILNELDL